MKTLVVFYSRTGTTRKVASDIAKRLGCETEEIVDTKKRSGVLNYLSSGRDARNKKLTKLEDPKKDPSEFDLVVIGTPCWAGKMSVPVRTYISLKKDGFRKVAFFYTAGGRGEGIPSDMSEACGKTPLATLGITTKDVAKNEAAGKITEFVGKLKG